jgi:HD-GYP domain-containing protein (c-di-GMP phosphodiesterase class II)
MRIRLVQSLKGGEKLAQPVITGEKETLISKGTILKPEYLDLLSFLGIDTVCVEDPYEEYETPHLIISKEKKEKYVAEVQQILEKHIYHGKDSLEKIKYLAEDMVTELLKADVNSVIDMMERNGNLYDHTVMVTMLSIMMARKMKVKKEKLTTIAEGCLLHDLGLRYITVPYLNCDMENRTASETFEYHKHTILAYSALENENWLSPAAKKMILTHHERKDGSGFPLKQKTKEIECNILQICDTFDCLISGTECKRVRIEQAIEYLGEVSDVLFDGKIIKVMQKMIARYPVGTRLHLSTGENGIVLSQTSNSIRPVVGILDKSGNLTDIRYALDENEKIAVLQIEN